MSYPQPNAQFIQVYNTPAGQTENVTTTCNLNIAYIPPLLTDWNPIDESMFDGPQVDAYVLYKGQQYRTWQTTGPQQSIKEG